MGIKMVIGSLEKKYEIMGIYHKDEKIERYFCKELLSETECCLIRITDKSWIAKTVVYFKIEKQKKKFKDFKDYFMSDAALCLVFLQKKGISLEQKMKEEECSFRERLSVFTAILSQITMLDMDPYIAFDCLNPETIFFTQGLMVSFSHWLEHLDEFSKYGFHDVLGKIRFLLTYLFGEEIKLKTIPQLNWFEKELTQDNFQNYLSLYGAFSDVQKKVEKIEAAELLKPQTMLFCVWKKIHGLIKLLKKFLLLLLFLAAIGYLIYNVEQSQMTGKDKHIFKEIGTLEIKK